MNSDEVFLRAALYEECSKSAILKHVDIESSTIETLRELLNQNNVMIFKKLPIILSKLVVKQGLTFIKSKVPQLKFMTPENIVPTVESDELQYLLNSQSSMKPNLVFMVSKNILMSVIGTSIAAFKNDMLESESNSQTYAKIPLKSAELPVWNKINTPKEFTSTFDASPNLNSLEKSQPSSNNVSRRSSISSNRSYSSRISKSSIASSSRSAIRKTNLIREELNSPVPNDKNSSDYKKSLLIEAVEPSKPHFNIISNVLIQPPNNLDYNYSSDDNDYNESNYDESEMLANEPTIKLEDIQETKLKPNALDFYSLPIDIGNVDTPTGIVDKPIDIPANVNDSLKNPIEIYDESDDDDII